MESGRYKERGARQILERMKFVPTGFNLLIEVEHWNGDAIYQFSLQ